MECDAVSDSPDALKTGTLVADGVADENTLIVNPIVENTEHMQ